MPDLVRVLTADRGDSGRRLDLMVRRHLSDIGAATRSRVQRWISDGLVTINGRTARRVSARTLPGDIVRVSVPETHRPAPMEPEDASVSVLYEDAYLLAVDKPAGLVVHPTYRNTRGTLMNALLGRARTWAAPHRPSLVGRLDKGTSGIVLVAKSSGIHKALQGASESGAMDKDYLAVVHGVVDAPRAIDLPLARDSEDRRKVVVSPAGARSMTLVEPIATAALCSGLLSLVRCRLVTGRTHQIRVHLAAAGWPIVGDPAYGRRRADQDEETADDLLPRQALHAWRLAFGHPVEGQPVILEAALPDDLNDLLLAAGMPMSFATGNQSLPLHEESSRRHDPTH